MNKEVSKNSTLKPNCFFHFALFCFFSYFMQSDVALPDYGFHFIFHFVLIGLVFTLSSVYFFVRLFFSPFLVWLQDSLESFVDCAAVWNLNRSVGNSGEIGVPNSTLMTYQSLQTTFNYFSFTLIFWSHLGSSSVWQNSLQFVLCFVFWCLTSDLSI